MDKCREEFKQWYEKTTGLSTLPYKEMFLLEDAENKYAIWQARQSEIDALKAQVEGLILQAGDMEKLAIEHMLERDAALIQVDELKAQVEELKANA